MSDRSKQNLAVAKKYIDGVLFGDLSVIDEPWRLTSITQLYRQLRLILHRLFPGRATIAAVRL